MSVEISHDEMKLLAGAGIGQDAVKQTVEGYRAQGLNDEEIRGRLERKLFELRSNSSKATAAETLTDAAQGIYQGLTNGFADEIAGGINGVVYGIGDEITGRGDGTFYGGFERGYRQKRDKYRKEFAKAQERNPVAAGAGEIAGAIANPLTSKLSARLIGKTAPLAKKLVTGAAVGAADGASYGLGKSGADDMAGAGANTLRGSLYGAAAGVAAPLAFYGAERGLNAYQLRQAKTKLLEMLGSRKDFENVDFGILRQEKVKALNKIRHENGVGPLSRRRLAIPANVVKHLQDRRILKDGMPAEEVADMLIDVFHSPKSVVGRGKYPHIQALVSPKDKISNIGFVGVNPANGETVVKTAYKRENQRLVKEYPGFDNK